MVKAVNIIVALTCLVCVLVICIAPFADLPETIIQPLLFILLLILSLVAGIVLSGGIASFMVLRPLLPSGCFTSPPGFLLCPIETSCVQQC